MTNIGVLGGDEITATLRELCAASDTEIIIERIRDGSLPKRFGILVINDSGYLSPAYLKALTHDDVIVLNGDNKALYNYLGGSRGRLITYGFNGKASVTASSVVDEAYERIQFCIQRSLTTLAGVVHEPQEFTVGFSSLRNVHCALAAITSALIAGLPIELLSE